MAFALVGTSNGITALDADGHAHFELDSGDVSRLARSTRGCWAIVGGGRLLRRGDDEVWHEVAEVDGELTAVLPFADGALAGVRDGQLLRISTDAAEAVSGFDEVQGRENWHAVPSGDPYVRSLAATADAGAVLANVHVGGIPRSTDGGATWLPTIDPEVDVHEVRGHPSDEALVVAAAGAGFFWSTDGGVTWTEHNDGLHTTYARAVAFTSEGVLVSVSDGPFAREGAVYRWVLGTDEPLERCVDGLPDELAGNIDTGALDASGEDAVLVDQGGAVYVSGNTGLSWSHLADVEDAHTVVLA
ncbi:MAG: hypothetical protein FJW86_07830 [Actinobacteria bacterium]|nr:hypothetical protein [Actinomycetota bacterium]